MTGAQLRAWRERLGKDDAWGAALLESLPGAPASAEIGCGPGQGGVRLHAAESVAFGYAYHAFLRKTLRAALEAEEARQSAERGPVEPVCPEGVRLHVREDGYTSVMVPYRTGGEAAVASVAPDGRTFTLYHIAPEWSPAILRYVADLMEHLTRKHAASDKQRKLDAVKAAEEAHTRALHAERDATAAREATRKTLDAARREAGL